MSKRRFISISFIFVFFLGTIIYIFAAQGFKRFDSLVVSSFFLNAIIWFFLLFKEIKKHAYSFAMIHWMFCILFFFLAAMKQYANDSFPWIKYRNDNIIVDSNLLLLLWTIVFLIGERAAKIIKLPKKKEYKKEVIFSRNRIMIITLINFLILLFRITSVGFTGLFMRNATVFYHISSNKSILMLFSHICMATSCFSTILSIYYSQKTKGNYSFVVINTFFLVLSYFPTTISRYAVAAIYGGIIISFFQKLKTNRVFAFAFFISFLVVFPFLNNFRYSNMSDVNILNLINESIRSVSQGWSEGHYDAYTTFTMSIDYVDNYGSTFGHQLLGVLLFFIPRSIWINKPGGSGAFMINLIDDGFDNISCSLPGEGYINYGLFGLIIFAFLVGMIVQLIDDSYWERKRNNIIERIDILYPTLMLLFFFVLRGDLMSSFAYFIAFLVVGIVMTKSSIHSEINTDKNVSA